MSIFKPIETTSSKVTEIPIETGQYIVCTDTNEVFMDSTSGNRIQINKSFSIKKSTTTLSSNSSSVDINIENFDADNDSLLVYLNSVYLDEGTDYTINKENNTIEKIGDTEWEAREDSTSIFNFVAFCNIISKPIATKFSSIINEEEIISLKYENALLLYTMMTNNLDISKVLSENKILYFYINNLWTKDMVYEAIELGLVDEETFEKIL